MIDLSPWLADVPDAAAERIRMARHVLAVGHENPDADAIGASLAVAAIVRELGGAATVAFSDPIPDLYRFLPGVGEIATDPDPSWPYDLLVVSDCAGLDRVGSLAERHGDRITALPRVILDHHASTTEVASWDWVDAGAAATCEMITLLTIRLGIPLTADGGRLAEALMAGVVMDTATFAHPNATPRTLAVAAALVGAGAGLSEISRRLYRTKPTRQLQLFGLVLGRMSTAASSRIVHSTLLEVDLAATGTVSSHSEGIIDLLSQAEEADVALLFKETGGVTRVSVRTRPGGVDATALTGAFGGGGHARAAGATVELSVADARRLVLAEAERLVRDLDG